MVSKKKSHKNNFIELTGWVGAVASLSAYFLVSFGILEGKDLNYQLLNLAAAIGLGSVCYYKRTYQPFIVNLIWGIVAVLALANIAFGFYHG